MPAPSSAATPVQKLTSALLYGSASLSIMVVNKVVLTSYHFPSFAFLASCQFLFTSAIIFILRVAGRVQVTPMSWEVLRVMAPLVIISLINVLSGLGGTQKISLPMFTALRRFSILMTMLLEAYVFGSSPSTAVKMSVFMMIFGALVAAMSDLSFDATGYIMIFFSDLFTALNGVVMKRTLVSCPSINKMAVLYYNSLFGVIIMAGLLSFRGEEMNLVYNFAHWKEPAFLLSFFLAAGMGSLLNYSIFLCTLYNSALTTTVVGCLKNILTTYIGMIFLGDYVFSWDNFLGLNISIVGSLVYSYAELKEIMKPRGGLGGAGAGGEMRKKSVGSGSRGHIAGAGSKREVELMRLLERPPSGSGRADGHHEEGVGVGGEENAAVV